MNKSVLAQYGLEARKCKIWLPPDARVRTRELQDFNTLANRGYETLMDLVDADPSIIITLGGGLDSQSVVLLQNILQGFLMNHLGFTLLEVESLKFFAPVSDCA